MSPTGNSSPISAFDPVFLTVTLRMLSSTPANHHHHKRAPGKQ